MEYSYSNYHNSPSDANNTNSYYHTTNLINIPNYTPPIPVPSTSFGRPLYHDPRYKSNILAQVHDAIYQKSDDELWIETYLSKIGKITLSLQSNIEIISKAKPPSKYNANKKSLQIHVVKSVIHRCIKLISDLEKLQQYLKANITTMCSTEWRKKTTEIAQQKDELSALLLQFEGPAVLDHIRKALNKRQRKRISKKRKKVARREDHGEVLKNRQILHTNIDKWLDDMKDNVEKIKREENLKRDADCILSEVTKKKSDARKNLSILTALVKLRSVREQVALQRGEKISQEDSNAFKHNTERLVKMWEDALKEYGVEEQNLRLMFEQNTADSAVHTPVSEERKITAEWEKLLFGPKVIPCDAYWGLTCANKDLGTFIALRKSWDTFLVSSKSQKGSRIPIGWILPEPQSDETAWSKYLPKNNT